MGKSSHVQGARPRASKFDAREEVRLWARLKRLRERGYHIRRQAPFRGYYLDFVCLSRRIVIELDGSQHAEDGSSDHDALRDAVLRREGFRVLRFWNHAVREDVDAVMDVIVLALEHAPPVRQSASEARFPHPDR